MELSERIKLLEEKIKSDLFSHLDDETRQVSRIPTLWTYTTMFYDKGLPGFVDVELNIGLPISLFDFMVDLGFMHILANTSIEPKLGKVLPTNGCFVSNDGFMVKYQCSTSNTKNSDVRVLKFLENAENFSTKWTNTVKKKNYTEITYIDSIDILIPAPCNVNNKALNNFLSKLTTWIQKNDYTEDIENVALIHMLIKDDFETKFKDFDVSKFSPKLEKPDLFYGEGFDSFNQSLIKRLDHEKKGVVLFHGEPGTGKTHYIRYLLRELTRINKRVIYIPPSMVESMTDPGMMSFLTNNILEEARDTIMLIEDAEPLLESRENSGIRTTGISNLLNSTDGILNDILGLVIIATFNIELSKIDAALLRPGRLMARKEFGRVEYERSVEIAKKLKIEEIFLDKAEKDKLYTIAEICNFTKDKEVLLHDVKIKSRNTIGFSK